MGVSARAAEYSPTSTVSDAPLSELRPQVATSDNLYDLFRSLEVRLEGPSDVTRNGRVRGLKLELFEHQRRGLAWMLQRERLERKNAVLERPFSSGEDWRDDDEERKLEQKFAETGGRDGTGKCYDFCGGMLCDEPGLGKTITVLALILHTRGETTERVPEQSTPLRGARNRNYRSSSPERMSSVTSLIVVPGELRQHWEDQIKTHVRKSALRVYIDSLQPRATVLPKKEDLVKFDVVVTTIARMQEQSKRPDSPLKLVHWLRVVVDEGHRLGSPGTAIFKSMTRELYTERRWIVTGTPSPNTSQQMDLQYMHGLLVFLRCDPYKDLDAWRKGIAWSFNERERPGYLRLQQLLCRTMIRHTKELVLATVPRPILHSVAVEPTLTEFQFYNSIAEGVRANLVITAIDSKTRGREHPDNLMNIKNKTDANTAVTNVTLASTGGFCGDWVLPEDLGDATLKILQESGVGESKLALVRAYFDKYKPRPTTICGKCKFERLALMILPCGDLCCTFCIEAEKPKWNRAHELECLMCDQLHDAGDFRALQPTMTGVVTTRDRNETVQRLINTGVNNSLIRRVEAYLETLLPREPSKCPKCKCQAHVMMIYPCGDLCCTNCMEREFNSRGPRCCICGKKFVADDMIRLQPGISFNTEENSARIRPERTTTTGKKRKRTAGEPLDIKRDFWRVDSGKLFYIISRLRELSSKSTKTIVFSQNAECIWRVRAALVQHDIKTANFIPHVELREKMKCLKDFRESTDVNVLLLSKSGAYGLDLNFVTHVFLLEEIWDKSLEQQVISRAYRMGTSHPVIVEKLWMKGCVECQVSSLIKSEQGNPWFDDADDKHTREEVHQASTTDKESFTKMKTDFLLSNLRVLSEPPENKLVKEGAEEEFTREGFITFSESDGAPSITDAPDASADPEASSIISISSDEEVDTKEEFE